MADSLAKYGLFIDDLSKIRILDPEVVSQANKLKEECQTFITKISEFKKSTDEFIQILDNVGQQVEKEKMKVIGARNLLRSVSKEREGQKQQMQALIMEKSMELERLRIQYDSLKKIEMEQLETVEHLTYQKVKNMEKNFTKLLAEEIKDFQLLYDKNNLDIPHYGSSRKHYNRAYKLIAEKIIENEESYWWISAGYVEESSKKLRAKYTRLLRKVAPKSEADREFLNDFFYLNNYIKLRGKRTELPAITAFLNPNFTTNRMQLRFTR